MPTKAELSATVEALEGVVDGLRNDVAQLQAQLAAAKAKPSHAPRVVAVTKSPALLAWEAECEAIRAAARESAMTGKKVVSVTFPPMPR